MPNWYVFAIFVFLLAVALVWFIRLTPGSIKKRDEKTFEREAKLFKLYQNIEDLMDGFEEYTEELKLTLRRDNQDLARRVETLEVAVDALRRAKASQAQGAPKAAAPVAAAEPALEAGPSARVKAGEAPADAPPTGEKRAAKATPDVPLKSAQKVQILLAEGMSVSEIAREMGISQNEVALMMKMDS